MQNFSIKKCTTKYHLQSGSLFGYASVSSNLHIPTFSANVQGSDGPDRVTRQSDVADEQISHT